MTGERPAHYSDLIMLDRQTQSCWQQFTGEASVGELAGEDLAVVPARFPR